MEEIRFTQEEMEKVTGIQVKYQEKITQLGNVRIEKEFLKNKQSELEEYEKSLVVDYMEIRQEEIDFAKELNDKYGSGTLDPSSGVFTPESSD